MRQLYISQVLPVFQDITDSKTSRIQNAKIDLPIPIANSGLVIDNSSNKLQDSW
ncbi:hypothetical protein TTHERM_000146239 (macronuclear) [Tetrahymena thermophila SB210]|uniref:Uncharacterized protein n=1 Tax=Tetrahymena thermophila (strain SB210) TaxID=312017 RepID=W7XJM9_TETTS|nr:hypothetical protein TTHERM_000146239 [Tetrahymena thermophila SB210]EWS75681.1 hypothetical protein TTHERM_000146239 [Tetrahymena thermophila SB210]|eukprot:XP_012651827.1 hypothetical protein TTHERM_000146239 [Tetrahymena thermophila SB210]